ncbi:MAG TPA: hypothetical protein P5567_12610 [Kiritimatiellia bacterium]|nr:hypothetical protein [Kiritimatiellia bacterium]HRZ13283.1 hypothetical protein [Kiritimatiellia bacterium]HSA18732.1 hypothetical protein [Kiritimatiellia bacterium]
MNPRFILCGAILALCGLTACGASTIDSLHPYAYGANIGWINALGDTAHGAVIGQYYCTGYVWSANGGWIGLGNGPANGWRYGNADAADWGVNHDGEGRLTGQAYGANVGWLTFEQTHGQPRVDLRTGNFSGYAWGANVGWISLSNVQAFVRTTRLDPGPDTDGDGVPDPWEYRHTNDLTVLDGGSHDADGDGATDSNEYGADTDPFYDGSLFEIVGFAARNPSNTVLWTSRPTRLYRVEATNTLAKGSTGWPDVGGGLIGPPPSSPTEMTVGDVTQPSRDYRVRAILPLSE